MSVTSSTDPVQAVVDILDAAPASDWTEGAPTRIERAENSDPSDKLRDNRRTQPSLYCLSPAEADISKYDPAGDRLTMTDTVQVDIYHHDAATANAYASDVVAITAGYATDNNDRTAFTDVWPETAIDNSGQSFHAGGFAVISVQVRMLRNAPV